MRLQIMLLLSIGLLSRCTVPSSLLYEQKYLPQVYPQNKLISAGPTHSIEQTPDFHYIRKEYFYETGQKTIETTYADRAYSVRDGKSAEWYDTGIPLSEGNYVKGKKEGEWKYFSKGSGTLSQYGSFKNNLEEGLWIGLDSLGRKYSEQLFKGGEKSGATKYFNPDGTEKLMPESNEEWDGIQIQPQFTCLAEFAKLPEQDCSERSLMMFLAKNIRYPEDARKIGISGTALCEFVVNKDGSISNVLVYRGICNSIKAECERILRAMPRWKPGRVGDRPVKVRFTIPVRFKIE